MRQAFEMDKAEFAEFKRLRDEAGVGFAFWRKLADRHGFDYKTVIMEPHYKATFSAMKPDHGQHWCFPLPLKCALSVEQALAKFGGGKP